MNLLELKNIVDLATETVTACGYDINGVDVFFNCDLQASGFLFIDYNGFTTF